MRTQITHEAATTPEVFGVAEAVDVTLETAGVNERLTLAPVEARAPQEVLRTLDTEPANMTLGTDGSQESGGNNPFTLAVALTMVSGFVFLVIRFLVAF